MRYQTTILLLGILAGAGLPPAAAEPASPEALQAMRTFVLTDCELGETGSVLEALRRHGGQLVTELERLLIDGPDATLLDAVTVALERRWEARQAFLQDHPQLGLDPQSLLHVTTTSREAFFERQRRRFELVYREKAAVGLAAIGSPRAWRALRRASEQVDPTVQGMILPLLDRQRAAERAAAPLGRARTRSYNN